MLDLDLLASSTIDVLTVSRIDSGMGSVSKIAEEDFSLYRKQHSGRPNAVLVSFLPPVIILFESRREDYSTLGFQTPSLLLPKDF
mmetsp:Transcript_2765/g.4131  ORF Transcript_2765/g.4131 Transcript_2765/m.4131 type:complete len:85 (-) Transcript_2765:30-284(-)